MSPSAADRWDPLDEKFRELEREARQRDCEHEWQRVDTMGQPSVRFCRRCGAQRDA